MDKAEIRESLIDQLKQKNADVAVFIDQIDAYMDLTELEDALRADIKNNGIRITKITRDGKDYIEDNTSVQKAAQVNRQRLMILKQLGISTDNCSNGEDEL